MKIQGKTSVGCADTKCLSVFILLLTVIGFIPSLHAETSYRVRSSDNLSHIVDQFYKNRNLSKEQIMVSILIRNPKAFKKGNINFLLKGRKLILPDENDIQIVSQDDALLILADQALKAEDEQLQAENSSSGINSEAPDQVAVKQDNQSRKITRLEKESESLRKQLELLVKEKGQRDRKLEELEQAMKESLAGSFPKTISKDVQPATDHESGEPKNSPKMAEKKNEAPQTKQQAIEANKQTKQLSNEEAKTDQVQLKQKEVSKVKEPSLQNNQVHNSATDKSASTLTSNGNTVTSNQQGNLSTKLVWVLLIILLGLFWYLFKLLKGGSKRDSVPDEDLKTVTASYWDKNDNLVPDFREPSIETNLKLDLAKAYSDIGDIEEANSLLQELIKEGSDEKKKQAQQILGDLQSLT